jgi:hypothetical protein
MSTGTTNLCAYKKGCSKHCMQNLRVAFNADHVLQPTRQEQLKLKYKIEARLKSLRLVAIPTKWKPVFDIFFVA